MTHNLKASKNPLKAIATVTYAGQPETNRLYRDGYEFYFNEMPILSDSDNMLDIKVETSSSVMKTLASSLIADGWVLDKTVGDNGFERTILAIEEPIVSLYDENVKVKEGKEFIVAKWGNGFTSPVHGHAAGFLYEELLSGKMIVNIYRLIDDNTGTVRLVRSDIFEGAETIAAAYSKNNPDNKFKRQALIHNFISVGFSSSLHYVPEHTRDGRDNSFKVENFDDVIKLTKDDFTQITGKEGMYLPIGEVCLVRSSNVPDYGDHYIVISGHPVMKSHGLRPQEITLVAPKSSYILDQFEHKNGLTLLKLNESAKNKFLEFHGMSVENRTLILPNY